MSKISKLFIGGKWIVAIKKKDSNMYQPLATPENTWIADPFLFSENNKDYIFVELFDKKIGHAVIAYYNLVNGNPVFGNRIIETNYHMSYPCIYKYENNIYMIPESSANRTIEIYIAEEFPNKWKRQAVILEGQYVDSTVFIDEGNVYVLSYRKIERYWGLNIFTLNMVNYSLGKIDEIFFETNIGRPAGHLYYENGGLFRPAQNCTNKYGESILIYKVNELSRKKYSETLYGELSVKNIETIEKIDRIHTINRNREYSVIDGFIEKIDISKTLKILKRKYFH